MLREQADGIRHQFYALFKASPRIGTGGVLAALAGRTEGRAA